MKTAGGLLNEAYHLLQTAVDTITASAVDLLMSDVRDNELREKLAGTLGLKEEPGARIYIGSDK